MDAKLTISYSYTWEDLYNDMMQFSVWTVREGLKRNSYKKIKKTAYILLLSALVAGICHFLLTACTFDIAFWIVIDVVLFLYLWSDKLKFFLVSKATYFTLKKGLRKESNLIMHGIRMVFCENRIEVYRCRYTDDNGELLFRAEFQDKIQYCKADRILVLEGNAPVLKSDKTQTQMMAWYVDLQKLNEAECNALMCYLEKMPNYELVNSYEWLYKNT
ncbi:hypothetical protein [Sellimonas intestinalis]|uniref:hypothetical protein n=1 Tax=Sellimonas intestinalis TaxID=1653434 RepID=UPI003AB55046